MKGIVAQIEGKHAIVLMQDGAFRKVRARPYMETGIEIDIDQPSEKVSNTRFAMKITSIAAAALLALGTGYGAYSYTVPYSYVHLDINPSIELTANVYDRIIKAEALNEDGRKLLEVRDLKHEKINEGVSDLLSVAVEKGYLIEDSVQTNDTTDNTGEGANASGLAQDNAGNGSNASVLLTISSNNSKKSGKLKKELMDTASKELHADKVDSGILVGEASLEQRNEAKGLGVTPGKLALIEDAMEDEPGLQLDVLRSSSVKDLIKKIQDKKKQEKINNGKKAGAVGQSAKGSASGNNPNNKTQTENKAIPGNQGNGKGIDNNNPQKGKGSLNENDQSKQASQDIQDILTQLKNQAQNNAAKQNNYQNNSHSGNQDGNRNKTGQQSSGKTQQGNNNDSKNKGKGEQTGAGNETGDRTGNGNGAGDATVTGNSKKIDEADRNTAGKNANELKKEREKLRNDLLNQLEKQTKERKGKLQQQKNSKADSNDKNSGKTNINSNGKKR